MARAARITNGPRSWRARSSDQRGLGTEILTAATGWPRSFRIVAATLTRSEEHTSELQSLMRISYAVFCLKKKKTSNNHNTKYREQQSHKESQIKTKTK